MLGRKSFGGLARTRRHLLNLPNSFCIFYLKLMSKIHIPTPLRQYVAKQSTVEVKGKTVAEAMSALLAEHPELRRHLYTEDGKLRAFVNLYVNDEDIRYLQKEETAVKEGDNISIVPSIAGGTH
jgi:molybdopterin converting factor small subunit